MLRIRGVRRSSVGPGASAKNIWRPAMRSAGSTAMKRAMMPMLPTHSLRLRHRKMPSLTMSKSVRIVAPVPVNPDIDSNSASVGAKPFAE